jgi:DNA polymerase-3 subunit gamma/tau
MVFYRKYRPQDISELDLGTVRERLTSILSAKELPHAFLFTGPKGLGKTSSARILAKAINCEKRAEGGEERAEGKKTKP